MKRQMLMLPNKIELRPKTNKNIWGRKLSNMGDMWRHSRQHFVCLPVWLLCLCSELELSSQLELTLSTNKTKFIQA